MGDSPRTPPPAPRKRKHNSESPSTPPSIRQRSTPPPAPRASSRHSRWQPDPDQDVSSAARNLLPAFEEEARLQEEADEFHAEQDGTEQKVPE